MILLRVSQQGVLIAPDEVPVNDPFYPIVGPSYAGPAYSGFPINDLDLIWIDPNTRRARLAPVLSGGYYKLEGKPLSENQLSVNLRAGNSELRWRWANKKPNPETGNAHSDISAATVA
jgi:hypothetical protein